MSNSAALMRPVRVIRELTLPEQFIRAVERATEIRNAARARADADFVERIQEAQTQYLAPSNEAGQSTSADAPAV